MKEIVSTSDAPPAIGPYSQGVKVNNLLFISGQIAIDPKTGKIKETIQEQTEQVLNNIKGILSSCNVSFTNVVKTTIYLREMSDFPIVNEIYARCFPKDPPARATVQVSGLPKDVKIEIDAIAVL